jgi:hypothetical protein
MIPATCSRGFEMADAIAAGMMTPELRSHAAGCEACLAAWLSSAVPGVSTAPATINPVALWARARRMRRLHAEAQISRIVTGAQVIAAVLILAVLVFFGSQPTTWASLSFAQINGVQLATGIGVLILASVGVSRLMAQDS